MRLVVSAVCSPTYKPANWLKKELRKLSNTPNSFSVKNSYDFIKNLSTGRGTWALYHFFISLSPVTVNFANKWSLTTIFVPLSVFIRGISTSLFQAANEESSKHFYWLLYYFVPLGPPWHPIDHVCVYLWTTYGGITSSNALTENITGSASHLSSLFRHSCKLYSMELPLILS